MYKGLAQQGAWGCFDEIHRIKIEVLSSITQHVLSIFSALAADLKTLVIENDNVTLVPTCGVFITTRPGCEDNSHLPDNFKSMFRTVSVIVPDTRLIAETVLFGEGFKDSKNLANKLFVLFSLCKRLLGGERNHYDYGIRGLVELIKYAGRLKRDNPKIPDDEASMIIIFIWFSYINTVYFFQIIFVAIDKTSLPNLTKEHLPIFMDIKNDLFPEDVTPSLSVSKKDCVLTNAIKRCMLKNNHQPTDLAVSKIVQLYEIKSFRRSVIIIGHSGAAKSTTWKTLRDALVLLKTEQVDTFQTVIVS